MKALSRPPRRPSRLCDSLSQRLNTYALAASAAGVGILALTPPAEAKIIYTKADAPIANHTILNLDNGRKGQFIFATHRVGVTSGYSFVMSVFPIGKKNRIWGMSTIQAASALRCGFRIGPDKKKFAYGDDFMGLIRTGVLGSVYEGQWVDATNRYLGLQFEINGRTHYGWARLSVDMFEGERTLTGYAYETVPNKAIIAGKTKGPDVVTVRPDAAAGTLGRLALGTK
jgi:hypothetical protein